MYKHQARIEHCGDAYIAKWSQPERRGDGSVTWTEGKIVFESHEALMAWLMPFLRAPS